MSMYNLLFGKNEDADKLLEILGLTKKDIGRFRDAYVTPDGQIAVYTRLGGGNRECLDPGDDHESEEHWCYRPEIERLQNHDWYDRDEDDDYDCTYATFYFDVPEEIKEKLKDMEAQEDRDEAWSEMMDKLEDM